MEIIQSLNLATAGEIVIAGLFVYAITQAIKQTKLPNIWMPWVSMLIGLIGGIVAVAVTGANNWGGAALVGAGLGAAVSGLFDGFKAFWTKFKGEQ